MLVIINTRLRFFTALFRMLKMKSIVSCCIVSFLILNCSGTTKEKEKLSGNPATCYTLANHHLGNSFKKIERASNNYQVDRVDDTLSYVSFQEDLYQDSLGQIFIKCEDKSSRVKSDCDLISIEYFKEITAFIEPETYKLLEKDFFTNKDKVFIWWKNSEGRFPVEIPGAAPNTFIVTKEFCCGYDDTAIYYGDPAFKINKIVVNKPESIEILDSSTSCWNCRFNYIREKGKYAYITYDKEKEIYEIFNIEGVDQTTFKLVENKQWDAQDKYAKYLKGERWNDKASSQTLATQKKVQFPPKIWKLMHTEELMDVKLGIIEKSQLKFNKELFSESTEVLNLFKNDLAKINGSEHPKKVELVVKELTLKLNKLSRKYDNFIATGEREDLCSWINHLIVESGYELQKNQDLTIHHREW